MWVVISCVRTLFTNSRNFSNTVPCALSEPITLFFHGRVKERAVASVLYFIFVYVSLHVSTLQIQTNYSFPLCTQIYIASAD